MIDNFNLILKNTKKSNKPYIGFNEPYLLYILPIIKIKPLIIIVIRNISDVINSCNKFFNYKEILHTKVWINYYSYFIEQKFDYICIKTFYYLSYIKIELTSIFNAKVKFCANV